MIEVHLIWLKRTTAVAARDSPHIAQQGSAFVLTPLDALDFRDAIPRVIRDIEGPLAWSDAHDLG